MKLINKMATAGAVAVMGLGLGAASASAAIELSPNPYEFTGVNTNVNVFAAAGLAVACDDATFTGNTSNSTTTTIPFHADYDNCTITIAGIPLDADVTTNSDWNLEYVSGDATNGVTADVVIDPASSGPAVEIDVPAFGCSITIDDQTVSSVDATNNSSPTSVDIVADVEGITYDSDCPGVTGGSDGTYVGSVNIPGITITDA